MNSERLIENLHCAIILIDNSAKIKRVNLACEVLFARSRRNLIALPVYDLLPKSTLEPHIQNCFKTNSLVTVREVVTQTASNLVDITLSAIPATQEDEQTMLIEINSINRISKFIHEQNQIERQHALRLMMRSLAHEIKNPLSGLRGAAQLLEQELEQKTHKELSCILIKEADRLSHLVDRVMGLKQKISPTKTNIHSVLEHVIEIVNVNNHLTIERHYDPTLPDINIDGEQMIQAILNIITNAIEAQQGNDCIFIGLHTSFDRNMTIQNTLYKKSVKIQIWDKGSGVSKKVKKRIFDPLVSGRNNGTGLGLSITQEVIQRHKGIIELDSYHGHTCFTIYLPYHNQEVSNDKLIID